MRCEKCDRRTRVVDSRESGKGVRRRHECPNCLDRFTTLEVLAFQPSALKVESKELGRMSDGRVRFLLMVPPDKEDVAKAAIGMIQTSDSASIARMKIDGGSRVSRRDGGDSL